MKFSILHESRGRIRVRLHCTPLSLENADALVYYMNGIPGVNQITVFERTGDAIIRYQETRKPILQALQAFQLNDTALLAQIPENSGRALNRKYEEKLIGKVTGRILRELFLPVPLQIGYTVCTALPFLKRGLCSLLHRKMEVELLDGLSIGVSLLRRDFKTASSVMFLLQIGELLEEWTRKKSVDDLARCMSLNIDRVWQVQEDGEVLVPLSQIQSGDLVHVQTGNLIPLDGKVVSGEAAVNQASLTGESMAVMKSAGAYAYAGTVVEEGDCIICVDQHCGASRYDRIVQMIETSEKMKSATENKALHLADHLVPYTLVGTALVYACTRNITRALSVLMVDFSCALKLAMPLAVLSAMRECGTHHITVKGGKYLEAIANADTIVFDKTGTLTHATPVVADIVPFHDWKEQEVLRVAACLEEHYPHSMANAVIKEAVQRHLQHEEMHSEIEYVVAHGISSRINGEKVVIGSSHFVFEDEGCHVPDGEADKFAALPAEYSHLYLAVGGTLVGVICIADPLREEANAVLCSLKKLGITKAVMMTGDNERTAAAIAKQVGVDSYYAEVLPEDKARFVEQEKAAGRTVIMIGDGINDSPALSAADAGIAISDGAAIAREIADITIGADDLFSLVLLKMIANGLQRRTRANYRFVIGFNAGLMALGAAGILQPATSALLHNLSTLGISMKSMTNLLD